MVSPPNFPDPPGIVTILFGFSDTRPGDVFEAVRAAAITGAVQIVIVVAKQ